MPTPALRSDVIDSLGLDIVAGRIAPGARVTLESVQERFSVSRTLARDCFRTLEAARLVESKRRVGAIVRPREEWAALDPNVIRWQLEAEPHGPKLGALTELRVAIEPVAAAAAARRATEEQRTHLLQLAQSIRTTGATGHVADYLEDDIAFHCLILTASQNDAFMALSGVITEVLVGRARMGGNIDIPKEEALELHDEVAEAIAAGDAARAEGAMHALVSEVRRFLLDRGLRSYAATASETD